MKNQALFFSKDKSKKIKMSSAAILFGALRVIVSKLMVTVPVQNGTHRGPAQKNI